MTEKIQFHFDPLCPWAWQGSRWIREVGRYRDIEIDWRLFSLKLVNQGRTDPLADRHERGTPALRTLALLRREAGNDAVGAVYEEIGRRVHDGDETFSPEVVKESLHEAGFKRSLVERALEDDRTMDEVRAQHDAAVTDVGCFGVPTVVLSSGKGLFGPVLSNAPEGEAAAELWDHVRYLVELDGFFELKRERDREPGD
jgi:2-hydroxychromene-2-carboxylate isomerase